MDWSAINWLNLVVLTASAFLAALIGGFIGRRNYALTAFLTAMIFAAIYIGWAGYLKQQLDQSSGSPETTQKGQPTAPERTEKSATPGTESNGKAQQ